MTFFELDTSFASPIENWKSRSQRMSSTCVRNNSRKELISRMVCTNLEIMGPPILRPSSSSAPQKVDKQSAKRRDAWYASSNEWWYFLAPEDSPWNRLPNDDATPPSSEQRAWNNGESWRSGKGKSSISWRFRWSTMAQRDNSGSRSGAGQRSDLFTALTRKQFTESLFVALKGYLIICSASGFPSHLIYPKDKTNGDAMDFWRLYRSVPWVAYRHAATWCAV